MSQQQLFDQGSYQVEISDDLLTATLSVVAGPEANATDVIATLKNIGIHGFDDGELIQALDDRKLEALTIVVCSGAAPVAERGGKIEYRVPLCEAETGLVTKMIPGQVIATAAAVVPGKDGKNVFGAVIPHAKVPALVAGSGVSLVKGSLTATAAGNLRAHSGVVTVHPLLELLPNDEALMSPIQFDGDCTIKTSLQEGRNLRVTGCLVVGGAIEAAVFKTGSWAHVNGGIVGREKGSGMVGGDLWCRFIAGGQLTVSGDVHVKSEIVNAKLACAGRLWVEHGKICSGRVTANGGITCHTLGNPAGSPVTVEAGIDQTLRVMLVEAKTEMDNKSKRAAAIREKVAPLMQHIKTLTAQQKEKATELMYEADELELSVKNKLSSLSDPCKSIVQRSNPEIVVSEVVHAGVVVRFPGVEASIQAAIKGPIRIIPRKVGNMTEVVVEEADGKLFPLPSIALIDHFGPCVQRLIGEKKAA